MSTEEVFNYRHKKFDQRKRSRDEDSTDSSNCDGASSLSSTWSSTEDNSKRRRTNIAVYNHQPQTVPVFEQQAPQDSYNSIVQLMQYANQPSANNRNQQETVLLPMNGKFFTADNRIQITTEPIDCSNLTKHSHERSHSQTFSTEIKATATSEPLSINHIKELSELSKSAQLPTIPQEKLANICKYRSNMARKFPKKERSSKELERRVKNTYACRKSRRIEKIQQVATENQYKLLKESNARLEEYAIRASYYLKALAQLTENPTSFDCADSPCGSNNC